MIDEHPPVPSLTLLSPSLVRQFNTISGGDVRLYKRLYKALWSYLWPVSRLDVFTLAYNLPVVLAQVKPTVTLFQFFMLLRLFTLSGGGAVTVNTHYYQFNNPETKHITQLMRLRFLVRTSFDPAHPYLVKPKHLNMTYISFTPTGISFVNDVVQRIYKAANSDVYHFTTGTIKKARTV